MTEEKNEVIFDDDKISKSEEFVNPDELYQELICCVQKYHPSDDISMIEKAYKVASEAHKNQFRKSGEPYIIHPLNVAIILADLKLDKETIVAGILHDVVEDTVMTEDDLRREFGDDVALLVDGVTKRCPAMESSRMPSWRCRRRTCVRCSSPWRRISVSL